MTTALVWLGALMLLTFSPSKSAQAVETSASASIATGNAYSCAVTAVGGIACWGFAVNGQLGTGATTYSTNPSPINTSALSVGTRFTNVSTGHFGAYGHTCAVSTAGNVYCWGHNLEGELGDGTTVDRPFPTPIVSQGLPSGTTFKLVATGNSHTCALSTTGMLYCWGNNPYGMLGDGTQTTRLTPVAISTAGLPAGTQFISLSTGGVHTCAVTSTGDTYCWGLNDYGQLGTGTTIGVSLVPVRVSTTGLPAGTVFTSVSTGRAHTCATSATGAIYCWGRNDLGQLGDGTTVGQRNTPSPIFSSSLPIGGTFSSVSAGMSHTCATSSAGAIYCWGLNFDGQLGDGTTYDRSLPTQVSTTNIAAGTTFGAVAAGDNHTCAIASSGEIYCWGQNGNGQLGDGTRTDRLVPVPALSSGSNSSSLFNVIPSSTTVTSVAPNTQVVPCGTTGSISATASIFPTTASGTVQFQVDGVNSGTPVSVASGMVTATLMGLSGSSAGVQHTITAYFVPSPTVTGSVGYSNSADAVGAVTTTTYVTDCGWTTTNVALSSSTVNYGVDTLRATATITSGLYVNSGAVQFKVDGNNVGTPVPVSTSGVAATTIPTGALTASPAPGSAHAVTAVYLGGGSNSTSTSSIAVFSLVLNFPADVQNIHTSIAPGTLIISTPYTPAAPLVLPAMTLNTSVSEYSTSAAFTNIQVTDTRPGNLPYTLSAIATNLTKQGVAQPGVNETINAQNIGLNLSSMTSTNSTPNTFLGAQPPGASTTGQNFTGFNNPAAAHVAAADAGSLGLGGTGPHTVLHANNGLGTTITAGTLTITAPTNTVDGTYAGYITFSIIGS